MDDYIRFLQVYPVKVFLKGQTILLKGVEPTQVYVIKSGQVKVYDIGSNGIENIIEFSGAMDELPLGFSIDKVNKTRYFYEAFTKCSIYCVPKTDYKNYMSNSGASALRDLQERSAARLLSTQFHISALGQTRARDKLAFILLHLSDLFGVKQRHRPDSYKVAITQQELANFVGLVRETASLELKKLEALELISHQRNCYIVRTDRLKKFLDI